MQSTSSLPFADVIQSLAGFHQALMDMNEDQERIDLFEKTAEACAWPQPHWPVRLILLLSGEAQVAAQQLTRTKFPISFYEDLKRAILQRVDLIPEQQRQRFQSLDLSESGFGMAHQLRDRFWNNSLPISQRGYRSGSSATIQRRWTWPFNWRRTGEALESVSLSNPSLVISTFLLF